jgi:cbb3-type cytochrome oxidase subunit 3
MIRNVLTHIGGIESYGIISVLLFFTLFTATLLWAFRLKRSHLESMGQLPLHDGTPSPASIKSNSSQPTSRHE